MRRAMQCAGCSDEGKLGFDFVMAFQPILDDRSRSIWGFEALVRGPSGEPAAWVLAQVNEHNRYRFDQACRVKAIETAGRLYRGIRYKLSINFMPNAVYEPSACIRASLVAADKVRFAREQLMFEFTENERMIDVAKVRHIITEYKRFGFITALDDFGNGYAGLNLLASFQPNLIKLDMELIRGLDSDTPRRSVVAGLVAIAREIGVDVLAEGVETAGELTALRGIGIGLMQGYHFAKPAIEALPTVAGYEVVQAA